jgi:hypothetical protein
MNTEFQTEILTSQTFHILEEPRIFCSIFFIKHSPQHIFYSFRLLVRNQSYGSIFVILCRYVLNLSSQYILKNDSLLRQVLNKVQVYLIQVHTRGHLNSELK